MSLPHGTWQVLLNEFVATVVRGAKEEEEEHDARTREDGKVDGPLDQLIRCLITFDDDEDLLGKIGDIYDQLDEDGSGGSCVVDVMSSGHGLDGSRCGE